MSINEETCGKERQTVTSVANDHAWKLERHDTQLDRILFRLKKIESCLGVNFDTPIAEQEETEARQSISF